MFKYNTRLILIFFSLYVIVLAFGKILQSNFSAITYALALTMIFLNTIIFIQNFRSFNFGSLYLFLLMLILSVINILLNQSGISDLIKIIGSQLFFFVGSAHFLTHKNKLFKINTSQKLLTLVLLVVPTIILLLQMMNIIHETELYKLSSIFINKNNAVVYFIALAPLLTYLGYSKKIVFIYLLFTVLLFKTLGAILAVTVALILLYVKFSPKTIFYTIFALILGTLIFYIGTILHIPSVTRLYDLFIASNKLLTYYTIDEISQMSFGKMVSITGSQDLSFFFRLKHWLDILNYYIHAPFYNQIFGIGLERIQEITHLKLVAHNDWLKMLVELGFIYPILYVIFVFRNIKQISKNDSFAGIFFLTTLIYFFSENLINNFLAMSLFYYFFGYYTTKSLESRKNENTTHQ